MALGLLSNHFLSAWFQILTLLGCYTAQIGSYQRFRGHLKCDFARAETRLRLSAKRAIPFKSAGASVQLTTGSRGVRISGSNAGYTMFRDSVKGTGYPLYSPVFPSFPLPCVTVCHHISTIVYNISLLYSTVKLLKMIFLTGLMGYPETLVPM